MKHLILLVAVCALGRLCIFAQDTDTHVAVHAGETPIELLMTDEQKSSVTHLAVTGKLLDADYRFIRENLLGQLEEINLRNAEIDTLPAHAFERWVRGDKYGKLAVILPERLRLLGQRSLYMPSKESTIYVTGWFPVLEDEVVCNHATSKFCVEGNERYETVNGIGIFSCDKDTLLCGADSPGEDIPEGTRVIAGHAYDRHCISPSFYLPESIDSIGSKAFMNAFPEMPDGGSGEGHSLEFYTYSKNPPRLGERAFGNSHVTLYVPDDIVDVYANAEGWNDKESITIIGFYGTLPSDISEARHDSRGTTCIKYSGKGCWTLTSHKKMSRIIMLDSAGRNNQELIVNSQTCTICTDVLPSMTFLLKVNFDDGSCETIKIGK